MSEIERAEDILEYEASVTEAVTNAFESAVCKFNPIYLSSKEVERCGSSIREAISDMFFEHTKFARQLIEARDRQETRDAANEHRTY